MFLILLINLIIYRTTQILSSTLDAKILIHRARLGQMGLINFVVYYLSLFSTMEPKYLMKLTYV